MTDQSEPRPMSQKCRHRSLSTFLLKEVALSEIISVIQTFWGPRMSPQIYFVPIRVFMIEVSYLQRVVSS